MTTEAWLAGATTVYADDEALAAEARFNASKWPELELFIEGIERERRQPSVLALLVGVRRPGAPSIASVAAIA